MSQRSGSSRLVGTDRGFEIATPQQPVRASRPWGPWATIGWTLLCIVVLFRRPGIAGRLSSSWSATADDWQPECRRFRHQRQFPGGCDSAEHSGHGRAGCVAHLGSSLSVSRLSRLRWPPARSVVIAFMGLAVVLVATDLTSYLTGRPLVPTVMVDIYRLAGCPDCCSPWWCWLPSVRKRFFAGSSTRASPPRGQGPSWRSSSARSSLLSLHAQYDWYGIVGVAAIGLYLGVVRYRTRSLFLTMLLHAVANMVATAGDGRAGHLVQVSSPVAGDGPTRAIAGAGSCR